MRIFRLDRDQEGRVVWSPYLSHFFLPFPLSIPSLPQFHENTSTYLRKLKSTINYPIPHNRQFPSQAYKYKIRHVTNKSKPTSGSLTTAQKRDSTSGGRPICHTPAQTAGNVCVDQLWGGPEDDVGAFGKTVFVRVDCATRAPLPKEKQDPLFKYDGVSMSPERLDGILQAWGTFLIFLSLLLLLFPPFSSHK